MDDAKYRRVFANLPELDTPRLVLKKIVPENAPDMYAYASLSEVTKYLLWSPHLNLMETKGYIEYLQREYRKGNYADWGINYKENGAFIGTVGFANIDRQNNAGELGYVLNPAYHGMGIMTEALSEVLKLAFETLDIRRIQLRIIEGNTPSARLAERLGFKYEGTLRKSLIIKGRPRNIMYYSLLSEEYDPLATPRRI